MVTLLDDVSVSHDQYNIGFLYGRKSVSYYEAGSSVHHLRKGLLYTDLCSGINRTGSLIKYQHRRQAEHYSGDTKKLLLSLAQHTAVLSDDSIITIGQSLDKTV